MEFKCNAVFEGGGVKGIGLVGGICGIEAAGYSFENVVGTSAGAIVASLLAVGYTGDEMKEELLQLDLPKLKEGDTLSKLGTLGRVAKMVRSNGIYKADYLTNWLNDLCERKGKTRFGDIRTSGSNSKHCKYRFQAIASDISDSRMLVLPRDLASFGIDPDEFDIASAVRMSMSIPLFYEPYVLVDSEERKHVIADGGLLSNYPIWLLDGRSRNPSIPTFGFKFCSATSEESDYSEYREVRKLPSYIMALVQTSMEAYDKYYISTSKGDFQRTIAISPNVMVKGKEKPVGTIDFNIKPEVEIELFYNGLRAASKFIESWSFEEWKRNMEESRKNRLRRERDAGELTNTGTE
jgi:NTE family protein